MKHIVAATAALTFAAPAFAEYPEKAINFIVGFRAGGGSDAAARILAAELEAQIGQKVIDLSLFEPLFGILGPWAAAYEATGKVPRRMGNSSDVPAPRNLYPTKDGKHVAMSASMQSMWENLQMPLSGLN